MFGWFLVNRRFQLVPKLVFEDEYSPYCRHVAVFLIVQACRPASGDV